MIVNVSGTNSPFKMNLISLNGFKRYKIRLLALHLCFLSKADAGIYKICTNLIDRENGNSERILAYVRLERRQTVLDFTPTHCIWYKLRFTDFSSSFIKLSSVRSDEEIFFSEFSAQFEITDDERV